MQKIYNTKLKKIILSFLVLLILVGVAIFAYTKDRSHKNGDMDCFKYDGCITHEVAERMRKDTEGVQRAEENYSNPDQVSLTPAEVSVTDSKDYSQNKTYEGLYGDKKYTLTLPGYCYDRTNNGQGDDGFTKEKELIDLYIKENVNRNKTIECNIVDQKIALVNSKKAILDILHINISEYSCHSDEKLAAKNIITMPNSVPLTSSYMPAFSYSKIRNEVGGADKLDCYSMADGSKDSKLNISFSGVSDVRIKEVMNSFTLAKEDNKELNTKPKIISLNKKSYKWGDKVEVRGENFWAFENDKVVILENIKGEKVTLDTDWNNWHSYISFTLPKEACTFPEGESGIDKCEERGDSKIPGKVIKLEKGKYKMYYPDFGSNEFSDGVEFVIE